MEFAEDPAVNRSSVPAREDVIAILQEAHRRGINQLRLRRMFIAAVLLAGALFGGLLASHLPEILQTVQALQT